MLHYWRKHPNLHGWFEELYYVKGGEAEIFNCVTVALELGDLTSLEAVVKAKELPETSGFFFGASYGDDDEIEDDLEFIAKARRELKAGKTVFYTSWW